MITIKGLFCRLYNIRRLLLFLAVGLLGLATLLASSEKPHYITLSGIASKAPINSGTATAFALNPDGSLLRRLGTATTGSDGSFSIGIEPYSKSIFIEVAGGTYTDEATGNTVTNTATLRAAMTGVSFNFTTGIGPFTVTPLTEIAVRLAGTLTQANIDQANTLVSNLIGGIDITTTSPADVTNVASATAEANGRDYGLILATISQMIFDGSATGVDDAITQISNDLSEGKLNTSGANISSSLANFLSSPNNQTGIGLDGTVLDESINTFTSGPIISKGYSMEDLNGTWRGADINTPQKGFFAPQWFGFDVETLTLNSDGTGTVTCIETSQGACDPPDSFSGIVMSSEGIMTTPLDPNEASDWVMGANKNIIVEIFRQSSTGDEHHVFGVSVKKAASYSMADLVGTWYMMGIATPQIGISNSTLFGFNAAEITLQSDGSGTYTCIASSEGPCGLPESLSGMSISSDGIITAPQDPNNFSNMLMGENKDIIVELFRDNNTGSEQHLLGVWVKKAASYSMADLAGTWYDMGIDTPQKGFSNPDHFGFAFETIALQADGTGTETCISASDPCDPPQIISGVSINSDGIVLGPLEPNVASNTVMGASKDIIISLFRDNNTGNELQGLGLWLKKAD